MELITDEKLEFISKVIEDKRNVLIDISDDIWEKSETRFEEFKSSKILRDALENEGFTINKGIAGMKTAFIASYGSGKPVISFLGEFDALYGLSQEAGIAYKKPIVDGGKGHGCGHNGLGTGTLAAAIAVKEYLKKNNVQGTVKYFGCPGEESGSGKAYIAREGYFKAVDAALTWHPANENKIWAMSCLVTIQVYFKFIGTSSHAAASPHLGRSALDAVELLNIGANYLREHIIQEARLHYAITDGGGLSPNVVQPKAAVVYQIRAPKVKQAKQIYDRVVKIAKGAALMTETELKVVFDRGSSNLLHNDVLDELLYEKFKEAGPVKVDQEDIQYAREIRKNISDEEKNLSREVLCKVFKEKGKEIADIIDEKEIIDIIYPYEPTEEILFGSTDVGDVSWNVPTAQITTTCYAKDTPGHSWQLTAQGKCELFHKGVLQAGKVLAAAAIDLFEKPELLMKVKKEFERKLDGESYDCPIPPNIKPSPKR